MPTERNDDDLLDHLYAVAMEPERFRELVDVWQQQLDGAGDETFFKFPNDLEVMNRHLERATGILSLVSENSDSLPPPLQTHLNQISQAAIAFTPQGDIESKNAAADELFGSLAQDTLANLPIDAESLKTIKHELNALPGSGEKYTGSLNKIRLKNSQTPFWVTFSLWESAAKRQFVLMKSTEIVWPEQLNPTLKQAFGLTQAETSIVKLLVEGSSVDDIASIRGAAKATVRTQVRSIYQKTSTRSQTEFLRMAIGLTSMTLNDPELIANLSTVTRPGQPTHLPAPEQQRLLTLRDGRILDYATFGPEDGAPCLFFHNEHMGYVWPVPAANAVIDKGLRIIVVARPWYGRSSPYPANAVTYEQFTDDCIELLDYLQIERVVPVSLSMGGMFALDFASRHPHRTANMVGITPAFPYGSKADQENMPKFTRFMSSIVGKHPGLLGFVARSGYHYRKRVGMVRFLETVLSKNPVDLEVLSNPVNHPALMGGLEFSSVHQHQAIVYDYLNIMPDNMERLLNLESTVYAVIGTDENNSRLSRAKSLQQNGAKVVNVMAEGGGELLLFTHPDLIADTLATAWVTAPQKGSSSTP